MTYSFIAITPKSTQTQNGSSNAHGTLYPCRHFPVWWVHLKKTYIKQKEIDLYTSLSRLFMSIVFYNFLSEKKMNIQTPFFFLFFLHSCERVLVYFTYSQKLTVM